MNPTPENQVFKGKWLSMHAENGYEFFHRHRKPNAVVVVALTEQNELVLVEQFRKPQNANVLEAPAGLVDDGETFEQSAVRELLEETGYGDGKIVGKISDVTATPGICTEKLTFIIMKNVKKLAQGGGLASENEQTTTHLINLNDTVENVHEKLQEFVNSGVILDMKLFVSLYLANSEIEKSI
jgi:ADP-ribose pyrophosphatase